MQHFDHHHGLVTADGCRDLYAGRCQSVSDRLRCEGGAYEATLAAFRVSDRLFWVLQEHGYEDETYVIAEIGPSEVRYQIEVNGGGADYGPVQCVPRLARAQQSGTLTACR
jgi:hypothetical protein